MIVRIAFQQLDCLSLQGATIGSFGIEKVLCATVNCLQKIIISRTEWFSRK
jgi:hypothetical protein